MRLQNKVVFITGAGSGMGRVSALLFAKEGAKIVAADLNLAAAQETVRQVQAQGGTALAVPMDVTSEPAVRSSITTAVKTYGKLDVLYNNAGIFPDDDNSVVNTDLDAYTRVMDVNLKGVYLCCKYGIPKLIRSGGGSVINIASFVALVGCTVPQVGYTASKGGVIALTKSL
ncbi:MAG: SDR family NAD(P)-dependent oxidoreductase, partial [Deinococcus sp.]|nr:SDR family NAD(P)-dependent oxidoreductase [Deinococcus sp.]